MTSTNADQIGDYTYLRAELIRRTLQPWRHFAFLGYFLGAIVVLGGLGIWLEILIWTEVLKFRPPVGEGNVGRVFAAMVTYYPAIVGASAFHLTLVGAEKSDKIIITFAWLVFSILLVSSFLVRLLHDMQLEWRMVIALFSICVSLWFWTIANADNVAFKSTPTDAASGGATSRKLKGDLRDFEVD